MHPELQHQKTLLKMASDKIYFIEEMPSFIAKYDKPRATLVREQLLMEYAEIMSQIVTSFCSVKHDNANVHPVFQELLNKIV